MPPLHAELAAIIAALFVVAFGIKAAVFPLYSWLSRLSDDERRGVRGARGAADEGRRVQGTYVSVRGLTLILLVIMEPKEVEFYVRCFLSERERTSDIYRHVYRAGAEHE